MGKRKSHNEYIEESIPSTTTISHKDKKKSKKNKSSHFEVENESSINDCRQALQTKKNKKKTIKNEKDRPIQRNEVDWSLEENKLLLEMVATVTKSRGDHSYKTDLPKLDFSIVSEKMNNRTSDECKAQFELLIKKVNKVKTMQCLISDTIDYISKKKNETESGYLKFMKDKHDYINQEIQARGMDSSERFKLVASLWKDLDLEEKEKYKSQTIKHRDTDKIIPYPSGFDLFMKKEKKNGSKLGFQELRLQYKTMELSQKYRYIAKSIRIISESELQKILEFKNEHPDDDPPMISKFPFPNKEEIKYYLHKIGMPEMPPKSNAVFYFKNSNLMAEHVGGKVLMEATIWFKKLSENERLHWQTRYEQAWNDYESAYSSWLYKQNDIVKALINKVTPNKQEILPIQFKEVQMPVNNVTFPDEPPLNCPLTPFKVYTDSLHKNGMKENYNTLKIKFKELSKEEKEEYQLKADKIKEGLILRLKSYVDDLTIDMKRFYLGLRRKKIMEILKEDIFQKDYPDEEYPVYIKPSKLIKKEVIDDEASHISSPTIQSNSKLSKKKIKRKLLGVEENMLDLSPVKFKQISTAKPSSSEDETDEEEINSKSMTPTADSSSSESNTHDEEISNQKSTQKFKKIHAYRNESDTKEKQISKKKSININSSKAFTPGKNSSSYQEQSPKLKTPQKVKTARTPVKPSSSSDSDTDENENHTSKTPTKLAKSTEKIYQHNFSAKTSSSSSDESSSEEEIEEAWHNLSTAIKKSNKEDSESEED